MTWDFGPCAERARMLEWLPMPDTSEEDLSQAYDFWEFMDRRLGGDRVVIHFLEGASHRWLPGLPISILNLGCGRGALARQLVHWARARKFEIQIFAVDANEKAVRMAKDRHANFPEIQFETHHITDPLFLHAQQFDYVISSLTLHHEQTEQAIGFLKTANLLAKRGLNICDWQRDFRAWFWISWAAKLWRDSIVLHDAPLAIRRGFTIPEIRKFAKRAGLDFAVTKKHFGYRFSLSGERGLAFSPQMSPMTGLAGA